MKTSKIFRKIRQFFSKVSSLVFLFQRSPIVQFLFPQANMLGGSSLVNTVPLAVATVVGLGAYDSVSGATSIVQVTPVSGNTIVPLAVGSSASIAFQVTNLTASLGSPKSWTLSPSPAGLNAPTIPSANFSSVTGTPTTPGTSTVSVTAWADSGGSGDSYSKNFTFCILGFSTHPASATISSGSTKTLTCVATGFPAGVTPTYQWYEGSIPGSGAAITGATAASYTTPALTLNKSYHVKVTSVFNTYTVSSYSTVATVTVTSPTPTITTSGTLVAVNTTYGTASATPTSFSVSGASMTAGITVTPPSGFEVSTAIGSGYLGSGGPLTVGSSGTIASTTLYVRLAASAGVAGSPYAGNIVCASTGATSKNVATISSSVSKRVLTVTATGPAKTYGTALTAGTSNSNFTAGVTGVGSETVTSVTLTPNAAGLSATTAAAASYAVTPSLATGTGGFLESNYLITYAPYNGTVAKKVATLTGTRPYDGTATANFSILSLSNRVGSDNVIVASGSGTLAAATAGNQPISSIGSLTLGGTAAGNYSLIGASGSVSITATPFVSWVSVLPYSQQGPLQTPQNDGVPNIIKYAFNMNPLVPDLRILTVGAGQNAGLPGMIRINGRLHMEYIRRKANTNPGIIYQPQFGSTLTDWNLAVSPEIVSPIGTTDWERVEVDSPIGEARCFGRVKVIQTP